MIQLADNTIDRFVKFTRFDVQRYVALWQTFVTDHYPNILAYYRGDTNELNQTSNKALAEITEKSTVLEDVLVNASKNFNRLDDWELLEYLDEIRVRIRVINVISKFLRSSKYEGFNENSLGIDYVVTDFDTPESIATQDRANPQDDWVDIFTKNHLKETDYTSQQGGYLLNMGKKSVENLFLNGVVDNLYGDRVYGKDMDINFTFENDDIKVLSPQETVKQSVSILANLKKGDIPEFTGLGISEDLNIGNTMGMINVPFISRELQNAFSTDDTLVNMQIDDVKTEGTVMYISLNVETFYNLVFKQQLSV